MKNSKLVEEAKLNPSRIYQRPHDVLRDRRLDDISRLAILHAWGARLRDPVSPQETSPTAQIEDIEAVVHEVERRLPAGPGGGVTGQRSASGQLSATKAALPRIPGCR